MVFPKNIVGKLPGVIVPFYYPEAVMGYNPETDEQLEKYKENPTMLDLVHHGFAVISADAYYITYAESNLELSGFSRWRYTAEIFNSEHPEWSGIGKLIYDTKLLIDAIEQDPRIDAERLGIAGHSLGGKMAFYTGCFDNRIKAILTSDFGLAWHQTNWSDPWYWGEKLDIAKKQKLENHMLLSSVAPKPFCLIAGEFDTDESREILYKIEEYKDCPERLFIVNHRSGHNPPRYAREAGYLFLEKWLK